MQIMTTITNRVSMVAYGGGTNSTALLIGMQQRGMIPDVILFADTRGERPETYEYVKLFSKWLVANGMPEIITVTKIGMDESLEAECLRRGSLPSLAYGFKTCSQKWKGKPQDKFINNWEPAKEAWKRDVKVLKYIGYDADEERRAKIKEDKKYVMHYPLIEWDWGREECIEVIEKAGLPLPGKSSCFFCPASKKPEIRTLPKHLKQRALAMEKNANLTSMKGLGRSFNWAEFLKSDAEEGSLFPETAIEEACGCYDG